MCTCTWDFLMKTRLLVHYLDGETFTGIWDKYHPFKDLNTKSISSLQIQSSNDNFYTLSSKKNKKSEFYSRQSTAEISILKMIHRNIWIELSINKVTGKRIINIMKERIANI